MAAPIPCPVCTRGTLSRHCPDPHPTCTWDTCTVCRVSVDRVTGQHWHPEGVTCHADRGCPPEAAA